MSVNNEKLVVGSEEWCAFPSLGIPAIRARVDSGAKTSALHAFNIHAFKRAGQSWVSFDVHPLQSNRKVAVSCEAPVIARRSIRNTSGSSEKRYVVRVPMRLGEHTWDIEITLANRDSMGYRMLLGREAMENRILVDPSSSSMLGRLSDPQVKELYAFTRSKAVACESRCSLPILLYTVISESWRLVRNWAMK